MKLDLDDIDRTADAGLRNDKPCQVSGRELKALVRIAHASVLTLQENGNLADGDDCTLIHLKRAMAAQ